VRFEQAPLFPLEGFELRFERGDVLLALAQDVGRAR